MIVERKAIDVRFIVDRYFSVPKKTWKGNNKHKNNKQEQI